MPALSRRHCLRNLTAGLAGAGLTLDAVAAKGLAPLSEKTIASLVRSFLQTYAVPGLSVAFSHQGRLAYQAGFGVANPATGEKVTPAHRFRIASVSKPITSVAIHLLAEQGRLDLQGGVFGGLLPFDQHRAASPEATDITVHHLLTHVSGGWGNKKDDPMFQQPTMNHAELIPWTLATHALDNPPGETFAYSNFGYCVLGRVIEKVSGMPYEEFVQQHVLAPCGVTGMKIAGNTLAERAANEVVYVDLKAGAPYGMNVRRMDAHGGWLATPADLVRFLTHVDGFTTTPDLLHETTIQSMTTASQANRSYACGFSVNARPNWWHGGSLPGTSALVVRTASGMCWAALANARAKGIDAALDRLMWQIARAVPEWQA